MAESVKYAQTYERTVTNSEKKKCIPKGGLCTISFESNGSFSAIGFSMVVSVFSFLFPFCFYFMCFDCSSLEAINQGRNG